MSNTTAGQLPVEEATAVLNEILELELAGVVRYTHYSLMMFGPHRGPLVQYMRGQASESLLHAGQAGELITGLGGHPSLTIGPLLETHRHGIEEILRESLEHEEHALDTYRRLLALADGRHVTVEEYARSMVAAEEQHVMEVEKMLRSPGELEPAR